MTLKKVAAAAAILALATPSLAFDARESGASTMFYISIPLDPSPGRKAEQWSAGMLLQGKRDYQVINIDTRMLNAFSLNDIEAKWMIAGLVAASAALAIGTKDKSTTANLQQQQTQNEQSGAHHCTKPVVDPCAK
jgi:hypothetical protein